MRSLNLKKRLQDEQHDGKQLVWLHYFGDHYPTTRGALFEALAEDEDESLPKL